ncbi:hypothetical protein LCGC14_2620840 [marine sediment metagenome]|uniref:Uncharacterized protein n=1 Tax=marine sediment metagenome TaxID=412755 RepID=A0A0F9CE46_9ZZZZ
MRFKPPKLEEIESYVREKNLTVDPGFFFQYFTEGEWIDSNNKPVRNWKLKILTWHRMNLERGRPHKCSFGSCKRTGIYIAGNDRDGHPYYRCIDHKPKPKPLPKELVPKMKMVEPVRRIDVNDQRNANMNALKGLKDK